MSFALAEFSPPYRLVADEPVSAEEFWRISAANPDTPMELAANGELIIMTPTKGPTGPRNAEIVRQLGNWSIEDRRGTSLESSSACNLPDGSIFCPDAAWVSLDRWTSPDAQGEDVSLPCPEFVIELRSKTDRLPPLRKKMQAWIDNGCELAWLIDPSRKAVEIYRPDHEPEIQEGHSAAYGEGPVGGFVLELGRIWG